MREKDAGGLFKRSIETGKAGETALVPRKQLKIILNRFWGEVSQKRVSRIVLLRNYAEIEVPKDRKYLDLRRGSSRLPPAEGQCWACRRKPATQRHHIVMLSNGGRNVDKNIVHVCPSCHAKIHPWIRREPLSAPMPFDATPRLRGKAAESHGR